MAKKKAPPAAAAAAAAVVEAPPAVFTPAEAKKLAKLLKASDRGKRLDAIRTVSENHGYITKGGCLLPLLESAVAKKKMEEVVKAAAQVRVVVCTYDMRHIRENLRTSSASSTEYAGSLVVPAIQK